MSSRPYQLTRDPLYYGVVVIFALITTALPALVGSPSFLTLAQTITLWLLTFVTWRRNNAGAALRVLALWAVVQAIILFVVAQMAPTQAEAAVGDGFAFRAALLEWLYAGGRLPASWATQPLLRLWEAVAATLGTFFSGGVLGVAILTRVINLAAFSAAAAVVGSEDVGALLLGLQPWLWLRSAAWLLLVATLSLPGYTGRYLPAQWPPRRRRAVGIGLALFVAATLFELLLM